MRGTGAEGMNAREPWIIVALVVLGGAGCDWAPSSHGSAATPTGFSVRAARRLYDGAPPVIPHAPLKIKCVACHTDTGKETPPLGFAPANPHTQTAGLYSASRCEQCHVFRRQDEVLEGLLAESDFQGLSQQFAKAERLYPGAPPVVPHRVFMREDCISCHAGPVARTEIRCSHPQRTSCRQCHVPGAEPVAPPELAAASHP